MATIKDGIKIGFGLLLFKWLLGLGSCAVLTVGIGMCVVCNDSDKPRSSRPVSTVQEETKPEVPMKRVTKAKRKRVAKVKRVKQIEVE